MDAYTLSRGPSHYRAGSLCLGPGVWFSWISLSLSLSLSISLSLSLSLYFSAEITAGRVSGLAGWMHTP